ncbi:MAG: ABC transporter permease [Rhodospirillaceae bacterium]|nr:ABC transporter permease [Rhodospirillaceae bacterium]
MRRLGPTGRRALGALAVALMLHAAGTALIEGYSAAFSIRSMLVLAALLGTASIGQTLVVLLGGIDLAIPFLIGFANVVAAQLYGDGMNFALVCAIVAALTLAIGAANGALSAGLGIHPLIVTLGVGTAVQGMVLLWTAGFPTGAAPQAVSEFVSIGGSIGPLPVPGLVPCFAVLVLLLHVVLERTPFGRRLYALGSNPTAAPLALISPLRLWTIAYALSALFAAVAGVLLLGFTGSAYAEVGQPYLFQTIAAVVIGGTTLIGGRGGLLGTVAGALVLTEINTLLIGLGLTPSMVEAALGVVIVMLVSLYGREPHVRTTV